MKTNSISTIELSILYFVISLVTNLISTTLLEAKLWFPYSIYVVFLIPLVMMAVVLTDMIKHHRTDWTLLVIIICTGGCGAALYPLWHKITDIGKGMRNLLTIITILLAAKFLFNYLSNAHFFKLFALRNDWVSYLGWVISLIAVAYAVKPLRMMDCRRSLVWISVLTLICFNMYAGILIMLLYVAIFDTQHPGKSIINKYLVLLPVITVYNVTADFVIGHWGLIYLYPNLAAIISTAGSSACTIAMIILLIVDAIRSPLEGKVWRLLPALFDPLYSVIALQHMDNTEQEQQLPMES